MAVGVLLPMANASLLALVDEAGVKGGWGYTLLPFVVLHYVMIMPVALVPVRGSLAIIWMSMVWGVVGYIVGRLVDRKCSADRVWH